MPALRAASLVLCRWIMLRSGGSQKGGVCIKRKKMDLGRAAAVSTTASRTKSMSNVSKAPSRPTPTRSSVRTCTAHLAYM